MYVVVIIVYIVDTITCNMQKILMYMNINTEYFVFTSFTQILKFNPRVFLSSISFEVSLFKNWL